ncbi:MAG: hypothetical protein ACFFCO_07905, partial [Promethearchaeota archaeon]
MRLRKPILLLLLSLFLLSSSITTPVLPLLDMTDTSHSAASNLPVTNSLLNLSAPLPPAGPSLVDGEYQYDGLGAELTTTEYAVGTNQSLEVPASNPMDYGDDRYGDIRLPGGWTGYQLAATISNLHDTLYWVNGSRENGDFESGGSTPDEWTYTTYWGSPSDPPDEDQSYYGSSYGMNSTDGVRVRVQWDRFWDFKPDYYAAWTNDITIDRTNPSYAKLSFNVRINQLSGQVGDRPYIAIYVEIEG